MALAGDSCVLRRNHTALFRAFVFGVPHDAEKSPQKSQQGVPFLYMVHTQVVIARDGNSRSSHG